jgi:hypothetical protein
MRTVKMPSKTTDPIHHLRTLPEYPEGTRVAGNDSRFWAAKNPNGDFCVFIDCIQNNTLFDLGEILPSIFLHADQMRASRRVFTLTETSLAEKFLTVFVAIANESLAIPDSDICNHIKREILEWSAFLSPRRAGITDEKLRGLWGELYVLNEFICGRFSPRETLHTYVGIHDAPQDLSGSNFSIEIKTTISRAPSTIAISSLEQLDANCPAQLLVLLMLVGSDVGRSISELVDEVISELESDVSSAMRFRKLVYEALDGATEAQLGEKFETTGLTAWNVGSDFPALKRSDVPNAIQSAKYTIALHLLSDFLMADDIGDWVDGNRAT